MSAPLPRADAAWMAAADDALFAELTHDLPSAAPHWLAAPVQAVLADPARTAALVPQLLAGLARERGMGHVEDVPAWPYDPMTGAPTTPPAIFKNPRLLEALAAAGRRQRVHPLCTRTEVMPRCDADSHPAACAGSRPRLARWRQLATTDPDQIADWWTEWPTAAVGLAGALNARPASVALRARELLDAMLRTGRAVRRDVIMEEAAARGISARAMQRAAQEAGVDNLDRIKPWMWRYPDGATPGS